MASVCEDKEYSQWWESYTLTDVTGRRQQSIAIKGGGLLLDLMAGTVPEKIRAEKAEDEAQGENQTEKIERFTVLEGLRKYAKGHVLLQGGPGSGKSTAMKRLLLEEAKRSQEGQFLDELAAGKATVEQESLKIPVLVELRYYDDDESLQQLIESALKRYGLKLNDGDLEQWLVQGQLLLLLDGVNELPSGQARKDLRRFRRQYEKTTPMVFTTRKLGEGGDLGIVKKLTMQPLSESQMQDFVQAYLPGQGQAMLAQLGSRLREFGAVPLLLWMLCFVYASNQQQIPANLGTFFRRFTRLYDNNLKQNVPDENTSKPLLPEVLQELAFRMMVGRDPKEALVTISRSEAEAIIRSVVCQEFGEQGSLAQAKLWLEDLLKYHLIQLGSTDSIQFRHQLIQEYYAAEKLLEQLPDFSDEVLKWEYLNYLKWTEPLALMAGLVSEEDNALRLVRLALEVDYELGARVAGAILEEWQPHAIKLVTDAVTSEDLKNYLLGVTQSTSALSDLLSALEHYDLSLSRIVAVDALGKIGDASAIPGLLSALQHDASPNVRYDGYPHFRHIVGNALGKIGCASAVAHLLNVLKHDDDKDVRRSAAGALGEIGDGSAVSDLLSAFRHDSNQYVRSSAADALGKIGDASAVSDLLSVLQHDDSSFRSSAADALGKIGDASAVSDLLSVLQHDDDTYVRRSAVEALGKIGDE